MSGKVNPTTRFPSQLTRVATAMAEDLGGKVGSCELSHLDKLGKVSEILWHAQKYRDVPCHKTGHRLREIYLGACVKSSEVMSQGMAPGPMAKHTTKSSMAVII